jgi:hypothetical protein
MAPLLTDELVRLDRSIEERMQGPPGISRRSPGDGENGAQDEHGEAEAFFAYGSLRGG